MSSFMKHKKYSAINKYKKQSIESLYKLKKQLYTKKKDFYAVDTFHHVLSDVLSA